MSYLYLALAIAAEVSGTTCMKLSQQFTRPLWSLAMFGLYGISLAMLTMALRGIPVGVAYAIWAGMGTALIAVIALFAFGEQLTPVKILFLGLIVIGVVGLNLAGVGH